MNTELKIYEIQSSGEREWVAARTPIEALQVVCRNADLLIEDFSWDDTIEELPKEKWKEYNITDEYGIVTLTFEQWMAVNKTPDCIACTAY